MNIDVFEKMLTSIKATGPELIGDYEFDDEEIEEIKDELLEEIHYSNTKSFTDNQLISFVIVIVNKLRDWKNSWEGNKFWNRVLEMFDGDKKIEQIIANSNQLYGQLASLFVKNGRVIFLSPGGQRLFAQTFLYQSYAPKESMYDFIKLAWNIYINEDLLDQDYSTNDEIFCRSVIKTLNSKFLNLEDDDKDISCYGGAYNIKASLRYGLTQNTEKSIHMLDRIFEYIHRVHINNEDIVGNHLGVLVTDKVNSLKRLDVRPKKHRTSIRSNGNGIIHSFSSINVNYIFDPVTNHIFLSIPKLILLDEKENYDIAIIEIRNSGKTIYRSQIFKFKKYENSQILNLMELDITDALRNQTEFRLEIILEVDDDEKYSSLDNMYRDFIVFSNETEKRKVTRPGDYYIFYPRKCPIYEYLRISNDEENYEINDNILSVVTKEGDTITGINDFIYFGTFKKSVMHIVDRNIMPYPNIHININGNKVPIYSSMGDIYLILSVNYSPDRVYFSHYLNGEKIGNDIKLSSLDYQNNKYIINCKLKNLNAEGLHEVQINEICENGYKAIIEPDYYYVNRNLKICTNKIIPYLDGDKTIKLLWNNYSYLIECPVSDKRSFTSIENFEVCVKYPYFNWKFGSLFDGIIHKRPLNIERPIFKNDIYNPSETIEVDTNLNIDCLYALDKETNLELKLIENKNSYELGKFLANKNSEYDFYCRLKDSDRELYLFSVTDKPYVIDRLIPDCFFLNGDNVLELDFSNAFIHDTLKTYLLNIKIKNKKEEICINGINPNEKFIYSDKTINDGEYDFFIEWVSYCGPFVDKNEIIINYGDFEELLLGEPLKVIFDDIDTIVIDKTKLDKRNSIKFKNSTITNVKFNNIDEFDYCWYTGKLRIPKLRGSKNILFKIKDKNTIREILLDGKKLNLDIGKKELTLDVVNEKNIVEIRTIFIKLLW